MEKINFKAINTQELWESFKSSAENISIENGSLGLSSTFVYKFRKAIDSSDFAVGHDRLVIADIALDECGIIYILAYSKNKDRKKNFIFSYDLISGIVTELGCQRGFAPVSMRNPSGIGIDMDTLYVADSGDRQVSPAINPRVIALSRTNFQIRWVISEYKGAPLNDIFDLAIGPDGVIHVLEENRVLKINRKGTEIDHMDVDLTQPTDISVDKNGNIYILDKNEVRILGVDGTDKRIEVAFSPGGLAVDANKQIFIGESESNEPTIYKLYPDGSTVPLWSYRSTTRKLITDSKFNLYIISSEGNELTFLEYTKIYNQNKEGFFRGTYISRHIDSDDYETRWHRFLLKGNFPEDTQIEFSYYISDELKEVEDIDWNTSITGFSSVQGEKRRDALFQEDIKGQYLWFKITLTGSETSSVAIRSLKLFFPRKTYIEYLPAIYQEDPVSRDFLERFLSIFESIFSEIDFTIENLSRFFDALGTPAEFLPWLETWLAISINENWPENKRRLLIQEAISLYKKRGTVVGLEEMIELYTGQKPFIAEHFLVSGQTKSMEESKDDDKKYLFFPSPRAKISVKKPHLFSWGYIEGKDKEKVIEFLTRNYGNDWENARIEKMDTWRVGVISQKKPNKFVLLTINDEKNKIYMDFYDEIGYERTEKLFVKEENCKLNVYRDIKEESMLLSDVLFGKEPFSFCVFLKDTSLIENSLDIIKLNENSLDTVKRIIEEQKPAHTSYGLKVLEPWFHLDIHSYLEVNTVLTKPVFSLGVTSVVGRDTVLTDTEGGGQIRRHSRVGIDIKLT